ncbi:MAG TPA: thiamine pyrophosphate-dependent enzyme, partial [Actinomycetota bacterium]|nr:thiamine pyrophosphate-dependent enzyme [Actinomycetota bacterium]
REPSPIRHDLLARAVGGHGERVEDPGDLAPALERAARAAEERPAVVDAVVDPSVVSEFMRNMAALELM